MLISPDSKPSSNRSGFGAGHRIENIGGKLKIVRFCIAPNPNLKLISEL